MISFYYIEKDSFMFKVSHQFFFRFSLFGQSEEKQKKLAVLFN